MTYYHQQILKLKEHLYPHEYWCEQVMKAKTFIDRHFSENISLEEIAGAAAFSKYHFSRLFKMLYGQTPKQYLISVRIEKAKITVTAGRIRE